MLRRLTRSFNKSTWSLLRPFSMGNPDSGGFTQKYMYEASVKATLAKLKTALDHIKANNTADAKVVRLQKDYDDLERQFSELVFYQQDKDISDDDWAKEE